MTSHLYAELRRLARGQLRREMRPGHTLQTTALVHEAYLRLAGDEMLPPLEGRAHFLSLAARVMRRVLTDHARRRRRERRGGGLPETTLSVLEARLARPRGWPGQAPTFGELNDALHDLGRIDPVKASLVEMRFFGGMTIEEIAEVTTMAPRTVSREWRRARAWLFRELAPPAEQAAEAGR